MKFSQFSVECFVSVVARRNYSFMNSTLFNNTPSDSRCSIPLPAYDPMNDPHLLEYFERRFGQIQRTSKVFII